MIFTPMDLMVSPYCQNINVNGKVDANMNKNKTMNVNVHVNLHVNQCPARVDIGSSRSEK